VVQEAYATGVSTRRVDRLVEQLGVAGMPKDQVPRWCGGLDEQVRALRERPLEGRSPYRWLDAKLERVRELGRGAPQGASDRQRRPPERSPWGHRPGRRGGRDPGALWREFLRGLRARGLQGVRLCASDAHDGLRQAIATVLGCPWRRCTVHFLRDMLGHVSQAQQSMVAAAIRGIFQAASLAEAHQWLAEVVDRLQPVAPKVAMLLEAAEAELLAFYQLPREHWSKLRSTNPLERVNREIGRRLDVVGIFLRDWFAVA
jgi:putative transposase